MSDFLHYQLYPDIFSTMDKPKNRNKKNQNENSEDEVDQFAGNTEAQDPVPQSEQGKKKKQKDDWEDDVASGVQALSIQTKGNEKELKSKRGTESVSESSESASMLEDESGMKGENDEMVKHMYETVLNHKGDFKRAMKVHLFCITSDEEEPICVTNSPKSLGNKHAEELLIKTLEEKQILKATQSSDAKLAITVYISNFPCSSFDHNCAKKLRDLLEKYENVSLTIYVTHLYKILRLSCETVCKHNIDDDFYANTCGLWNLKHHKRCNVRPYDKTVWKHLLNNKHIPFSEEVKKDLMDNYDAILKNRDKTGYASDINYDRSRMEEDQLTKKDLEAIDGQILKQLLEIKDPSRNYKQTCLVCNITAGGNTFKLAKSDQGNKHAVELLLEELRDLGIKDETLTITIFMNDTPCSLGEHDCAGKFVQYLQNAKAEVKLTVCVTSLCEAKEETCTKIDKTTKQKIHSDCSKKDKSAHEVGLAKLLQLCKVIGPSKEAWEELFSIMNMPENDQTIKDFWETYELKDEGSRKLKNRRIRSYLKWILSKKLI